MTVIHAHVNHFCTAQASCRCAGHYIVVVGYDAANDRFIYRDPSGVPLCMPRAAGAPPPSSFTLIFAMT